MWRIAPRLLEENPPPPSSTPRRPELPLQGKCEGKKLGGIFGEGRDALSTPPPPATPWKRREKFGRICF